MNYLGKRSQEEIYKCLGTTLNEDIHVVRKIEGLIRSRHNRSFSISGKAVVLPFSGGVDSLAAVLLCFKEECNIYPIFIDRCQRNLRFERKAALELYSVLHKEYPRRLGKWFEIKLETPPKILRKKFSRKNQFNVGLPMRNTMFLIAAVQYARALTFSLGKKVNTIVPGYTFGDSNEVRHSTLTSCRLLNLEVCFEFGEWDWRIIPVMKEPDVGYMFSKSEAVRLIQDSGIPLSMTRSCVSSLSIQCGRCHACRERKEAIRAIVF